jgi:TorA maturation chaperone TorD
MSNTNKGGTAFPVQSVYIEDQETNSHGMTLRDYFAAKAMQGLFASNAPHDHDDAEIFAVVAEAAYKQADAMLEERGV